MNVETTDNARMNEETMSRASSGAAASTAGHQDLAPPFHHPWVWNRSYPPAGFWSAYRHFDNRGELVLQLGRRDAQGSARATSSYARWESHRGTSIYAVRFEPTSLSRRPNSANQVNLRAFLQINWNRPKVIELHGGTQYMAIAARGPHLFRAGFEVELQSGGTYGEVIGKIADVNRESLFLSQTQAESLDAEPSLEEMRKKLARSDGGKVEVVELGSLEEVTAAGAEIFARSN